MPLIKRHRIINICLEFGGTMDSLSYLLMKLSRQLKNSLDNKLSIYKITASQFSVLNQIAISNGVITSAEIADSLNSDRPTISGVINRLESKKLVHKITNPNDKRSVYLKLDNNALKLVDELRDISDQLEQEIFSLFDEVELLYLRKYLYKLIEKTKAKE